MKARRVLLLVFVASTLLVSYFVASVLLRVWEIYDSLRVPGWVESCFIEVFQLGIGTGFIACLYLVVAILIAWIYRAEQSPEEAEGSG